MPRSRSTDCFPANRAIQPIIASTMIGTGDQTSRSMPQTNESDLTLLSVKVIPNASRNQIASWENDTLKIRIQSPPLDGKANKALIAFLSKQTQVPKNRMAIQRGKTSRQKWIAFSGIDRTALLERLGIEKLPHG